MKLRFFAIAALVLLGCCVWLKNNGSLRSEAGAAALTRTKSHGSVSGDPEASGVFRTKVSNRQGTGPRATHSPDRLKEFMLPQVAIDGLTLGEALQKLMGVYEETCAKTGETPLRLTFDLPSGNARRLKLKLSPRNFNSSVQILATFSGMNVSRSKTAYHFKPFPDEQKQVKQATKVPPDFALRLIEQAGIPPDSCFGNMPIGEILKASGLHLDPSTQFSLDASGVLNLETTSSADAAMISALADTLAGDKPVQHKFTSQLVEIPAGTKWTPPDVSQMTGDQVQSLIREVAHNTGTNLTRLPSVTARNGQAATIEITRELIGPTDDSGTSFEKHDTGKVMHMTGHSLGFGQQATVDYTDTIGGLDEAGKKLVIEKRTDLADSGYSSDGDSRLIIQSRADGSKTLLIVTGQLIDATGRPVHGGE